MTINIPANVNFILTTLQNHGHTGFIVGGCVRDALMGVSPTDWDITTSATPVEVKALFARTIDTGLQHGTVTVLIDKTPYEVTTYRIDGQYIDGRRPLSVEFVTDIVADLSRRDFTMNAIAYSPSTGFVDPFHGQVDINQRRICCVGDPVHRFGEDALRMLRAIRFSATTGFSVCHHVERAIGMLAQHIAQVSPERIRVELGKLLQGKNPAAAALLYHTGLLATIIGRNTTPPKETWAQTLEWIAKCPPVEAMRLALFFHWAREGVAQMLRALRFENALVKETAHYVALLFEGIPTTDYHLKKWLRHIPKNMVENIFTLHTIVHPQNIPAIHLAQENLKQIKATNGCYTLKDLAINGRHLAQMGLSQGQEIGEALELLLDFVLQHPEKNEKEVLENHWRQISL